ncbi:DNA-binding protein [Lysobacter sp. S4-A87]|nr:DNA-binding protein [Lysobacter sp. S4-A87]
MVLIEHKVQPTVEHIRMVLGRGSPNVIHPALRSFFYGPLQRRLGNQDGCAVPEALVVLWRKLRVEAQDDQRPIDELGDALRDHRGQNLSDRMNQLDIRLTRLSQELEQFRTSRD